MAGTGRGGRAGSKSPTGAGMVTPTRISPRTSMDSTLDLLTGFYSANYSLLQEVGITGEGTKSTQNSPTQVDGAVSEESSSFQGFVGGRAGSKSPTEAGMVTPTRISPMTSMDSTLDLLTGCYPANYSLLQEVGTIGEGTKSSQNSPTQIDDAVSEESSNFQVMIYNSTQQHQPLDLLTGLFPPSSPSPSPSPLVSPPPAKQNAWGPDTSAYPAFGSGGGSSSIDLSGPAISARNNPFLDNAVKLPAYFPPPLLPLSRGTSDEGGMSNWSNRSAFIDDSFVKFHPIGESMANKDLEIKFDSENSPSPTTGRVCRAQPVGSGSTPANSTRGTGITGSSLLLPQAKDSFSKSDVSVRHSSVPSGIGLERMQNGPSSAEYSSSSSFHHGDASVTKVASTVSASPPPNEKIRKGASEPKYDRTPSRTDKSSSLGKHPIVPDSRTLVPSSKVGAASEEFFGASGKGIYKAPVRGAVHPSKPVSLELRPHPLRGALANQVTRIISLEGSVWAACDLGLMIWDVENAIGEGSTGTGNNVGDEDAASYEFLSIQGSSATCMIADAANQVVWTGFRDGKIRSWSARVAPDATRECRAASLTFQAFWPAVTALVFTSYGELWAGSESGELKAWPWTVVAKALSGVGDGATLMEKSYSDLNIGHIGVGPNGPINPEVRFLVGDHAHGTVWSAGTQYIAIWDARTRDRLKIFVGPNGLDFNSIDAGSSIREIQVDEDFKVGYAKVSSKKDKGGWLQRSRNVVMGAADAVRRVASGGVQGGEDGRKLEALVAAPDGTVWGGYGNGILAQWDGQGCRLQELCGRPVSVRCLGVVGNRVWVGYSDGKLQVLDGDTGKPVGSWLAHRLGVSQMAVCGGYIFSLGLSGSIRGWHISSPNPTLDGILAATMSNRADSYTRQQHLQVLAVTWNTAQEKCCLQSTQTWLAPAAEASLVVVGLQEVEVGAGALGMAAVKESVGMGLDKGSATGQWWLSLLDNVLGEGKEFERVGSRQLAGMLVGVWVRRTLLPYVGDVEVGAVACGFGRALGNKGAVGVKLMIFRRTICVLNSHLAAHMEHTSRRNADFEHIYNQMSFGRSIRTNVTVVANAAADLYPVAGVSSAVQNLLRGVNTTRRVSITSEQNFIAKDASLRLDSDAVSEDPGMPELAEADLLIWTGDLNYRIDHLSYEEIINLVYKKHWDALLSNDQLRYEMQNGRTFHGLREGAIRFQPTYKFDKGTNDYDTSEKKRTPAWCDRVLFRDSFGSANDFSSSSKHGLIRPCKASVVWYETCMEPKESDHKPVRCMLRVDLSVTDEAARRHEYGDIMHADPQIQTCLLRSCYIPDTVLSTNRLVLEGSAPSMLRLSNGDRVQHVVYVVHCEGLPNRSQCPCRQHSNLKPSIGKDQYPRGGYGFPYWLQVGPAAGVLKPCDSISISVKFGLRSEDNGKDQQYRVVLVVNVKGVFSSEYQQHRICVCGPSSQTL